jgi:hypothetical protein
MRMKIGLVAAALAVAATATLAMEVTVVGNAIILSGPVTGDELPRVKKAFAQNPAIQLAVLRNSWGGHAPTGYRLGELFRERGMTTAVSGFCVSSCSRMFLGGRERLFTRDYPPEQTFVGFHGHYDAKGNLNAKRVAEYGLYTWIIQYSDGKADAALVRRWINIPRASGAVNFYHPDLAANHRASVFVCDGHVGGWPQACASLPTDALERGVITDTRRIASPG